jgi:hypothetical protein
MLKLHRASPKLRDGEGESVRRRFREDSAEQSLPKAQLDCGFGLGHNLGLGSPVQAYLLS